MKKVNIVRKKYEFDKIIHNNFFVKNDYYIIYYYDNSLNNYRFGISVGKKLGNSVFRNKYKRKIRSIVDNNKKNYQNDLDYIIIMRKGCIDKKFSEQEDKFIELINKIKIRRERWKKQKEK